MRTRNLVSLTFAIVSLTCCFAHAEGSYFGAVLGPDFVSFSTNGSGSATQVTGGAVYEDFIMPLLSIQPELRYTNKTAGTASYEFLTIPVLAKAHLPTLTLFTPNAGIGPDFNFKLSGPNGTSSFLFALDLNAGVDADIAPSLVASFDLRYALGMTDTIPGLDSKTREVALLFGVKFKI